ncbi:MAG: PRC-barrel domain-containing protein, partial [Bradyrhizobium sp.]
MRARIFITFVAAAFAVLAPARAADDQGSPPATKTAPQDGAKKEPAPPPSVTVIGARDAHGILGREVRSAANENMGRIVDVIVDREGTVRAAVIDFGGFLGVGSRKIVVDWNALHFASV